MAQPRAIETDSPCSLILQDGLYEYLNITTTANFPEDLRTYFLSETFRQDVTTGKLSAGIDVIVEGVPINLNADNFSSRSALFYESVQQATSLKIAESTYDQVVSRIPNVDMAREYIRFAALTRLDGFKILDETISGALVVLKLGFRKLYSTSKMPIVMCIFTLLVLTTFNSIAQNNEDLVQKVALGPYKWTVKVLMEEVDINGTSLPAPNKIESLPDQLFDVIQINKDDVLIKITTYDVTATDAALRYNYKTVEAAGTPKNKDNQRYFKVSKEILQGYAVTNSYILPSLTFGLLNFPFKYRTSLSGSGDFAGAFNFGAAIGVSARKKSFKNRTWSFISGYSISNTVLNKSDVRRNENDLPTSNNYTSFSLSFGPMIEYNKVQAGAFIGFDFLNRLNQDRFGWKNQGKLWFSIGIGYTIFSKQGDEKVTTEINKKPKDN